jgi:hypothetical protein
MPLVDFDVRQIQELAFPPDAIHEMVSAAGEELGRMYDECGGQMPEGVTLYTGLLCFVGASIETQRAIVERFWYRDKPHEVFDTLPTPLLAAMALGVTSATLMTTEPRVLAAIVADVVAQHSKLLQAQAATSSTISVEPIAQRAA